MPRPSIKRGPASSYAATNETILEISNGIASDTAHKGALLSLRNMPDGRLVVSVYRADAGVEVKHLMQQGRRS